MKPTAYRTTVSTIMFAFALAVSACSGDGGTNTGDASQSGSGGTGGTDSSGGDGGTLDDAGISDTSVLPDGASVLPDGATLAPDGGVSVCAGVACGPGSCVEGEEGPVCACPPHVIGTTCQACERGYMGSACDTCAAGYIEDSNGRCVLNPCSVGYCQHGGTCSVDRLGAAECSCPPQYAGTKCEMCAPNHTGPTCTDCVAGFTREGGICKPIICLNYDCGNYGWCVVKNNAPVCACKDGYTGAKCDTCTKGYQRVRLQCVLTPPTVGAPLDTWFDAADPRTLTLLDNGDVTLWANKIDVFANIAWFGGKADSVQLPRYSAQTRGVVFDDDILQSNPHTSHPATFTTFMVLRWSTATGKQTIWRHNAYLNGAPVREHIYAQGSKGVYSHQALTAGPVDVVEGDFYASAPAVRLMITKRAPFLNGTVHTISNGTTVKTIPAQAGAITDPLFSYMGASRYTPLLNRESLHGTLHEILRYSGSLTKAEEQAVIDYLTVKWGL